MTEIDHYLANLDQKRRADFQQLFDVVQANLPPGFELDFRYGMIGFSVPLSRYPKGYLGRQDEALPFINLAAQKKHLALYHLGLMGNPPLLNWFQTEYAKVMTTKLNMGKSCIRFTNSKTIPYGLIAELVSKITVDEWVDTYEKFNGTKK